MEKEVLEAVLKTSENIDRLTTLIFFGVAIWIIKTILVGWNNFSGVMKQQWRVMAQDLYQEGKNEKLLNESKKKIIKEPKNAEGFYWKALAEGELKKESDLPSTISALLDLAPDWKQDWMEPYTKSTPSEQT